MNYVSVASTTDLAADTMQGVEAGGLNILLANVGGTFRAIQRKCPHMGADLCAGRLDGNKVICRMHGAAFDLTTGEAVAKAKLLFLKTQPNRAATYPVRIEGDEILVGI